MKKIVKKAAKTLPKTAPGRPDCVLPFGIGDKVLIRTVTMIDVGRVADIGPDFIVLKDASWVADTGRFSEALAKGTLNEVERYPRWCLVGRGAIVDIAPWDHPLPQNTK